MSQPLITRAPVEDRKPRNHLSVPPRHYQGALWTLPVEPIPVHFRLTGGLMEPIVPIAPPV